MSASQALMNVWSGQIVITDSDEEESDGEQEQPQPLPQGGARVTTSVRHTRSSAAAAAAETWTARTAAMAAKRGEIAGIVRVRLKIVRNSRINSVGESESCMVYKLRIIPKRTVDPEGAYSCVRL